MTDTAPEPDTQLQALTMLLREVRKTNLLLQAIAAAIAETLDVAADRAEAGR